MTKKRPGPDFDTVAFRLYALREVTGLTRNEVEENCGIKSQSLKGWERGYRGLKERNAKILSDMYKAHGVDCTPEWILHGTGLNPFEKLTVTPENDYIVKDITRFKAFYPNAVVLEATDDHMAPWIRKGDLVGGILTENLEVKSFVENICIVKTQEFGTHVRLVKISDSPNLYNLTSLTNNGNIFNVSILAVAPVRYLRRCLNEIPV